MAGKDQPIFREILIHVNVRVPESDSRSAEEIEKIFSGVLEVGSDTEELNGITSVIAFSEEIGTISHSDCERVGVCFCPTWAR